MIILATVFLAPPGARNALTLCDRRVYKVTLMTHVFLALEMPG